MRIDEVEALVPAGTIVVAGASNETVVAIVETEELATAGRRELRAAAPDLAAQVTWIVATGERDDLAAYARTLAPAQPETALERIVATAWHEGLGIAPASIDEDFFAAGGHSLLASEIAARLEDLLALRVPLTIVFDHPTVREQAAWLASQLPRRAPTAAVEPATTTRVVVRSLHAIDNAELDLASLHGAARRAAWARFVDRQPSATPAIARGSGSHHLATFAFDARDTDDATARAIADDWFRRALPVATPAHPIAAQRAIVDSEATLESSPPWRAIHVSPDRVHALLEAGRRRFATPETTWLAAVAIALARELGVDRIVLGVPASIRTARDDRGALTTIAPVVVELHGAPSFARIVERLQSATCRAWAVAAGWIAPSGEPPALDALVEITDRRTATHRRAARALTHVLVAGSKIRATGAIDLESLDGQLDALAADPDRPLAFGSGALDIVVSATDAESPPLPLSHAQERLWFLEELSPGSTLNHLQRTYRLDGPLDRVLLDRAIRQLTARHDAMRTRFVRAPDGTPRQIVMRDALVEHRETIGSGDLAALQRAEYARIFALDRGPLSRTLLVAHENGTHSLIFTIHHLIVDALSMLIWFRELAEIYHALVASIPAHLARLGTTVAELAAWERSDAGRARIVEDLAYWTTELAGATPMALPLDYRRPASHGLGRHEFTEVVPPDRAAELRALGRFHGATLNVTLLAAAFAFLARTTDRDDLVGIVPAARRDAPGRAAVMGLVLNLLPLRVRLDGDPTFHEIIARTNRAMRAALAHAEAPFERVVAALGLAREPGRQPLFDVILNMIPGAERLRKGELKIAVENATGSTQPCDMVVGAATRAGGLLGLTVRCRDDLFTAITARRSIARFLHLVLGAIANPATRLSELPLIPAAELAELDAWNRTDMPLPEATVHDLVVARLRANPDRIAIVPDTTARELDERSLAFAHALIARGIAPGTRVGIAIPPGVELAIAALGTMRAGAIYAPLDASQPAARYAQLAAGVEVVISEVPKPKSSPLCGLCGLCGLCDFGARDARAPANLPIVGPDAPAYVVFTSGSTGTPKSVVTTHRGLVNQIAWFATAIPWAPTDISCLRSSPAFVDSLWELFGPLVDGIPLAIAPREAQLDPRLLVAFAAHHRVTRMVVVPSLLQTILALGAPPELHTWLATSEELKPSLVAAFFSVRPGDRLINLYGASETADQTAAFDVRAPDPLRTPIGTPIANARLYVVDRAGRRAPIGVAGELHVAGVGVSEAYLSTSPHLPERTYRTGDRGRWRHDGTLEYLGRVDHVVKIRGIRIDPAEIEAAILAHPLVTAAVVTAAPGFDGETRLVAHVVTSLDRAGLRAHLRTRLPETLIPTTIVHLPSLPLGPTGKVDRAQLPAPAAPVVASRAPTGTLEVTVAEVWEALLGHPTGAEDDFFAAGGQSLIAAQLGALLATRFALDIPLHVLFERPTIAAQAAWIDEATRAISDASTIRVAPGQRVPLSYAQERMWFATQLAPDAPAPKIRLALRITGALDVPRLEAALDALGARHGSLRTTFEDQTQRVLAAIPRDHARHDIASDDDIRTHVAAERDRPFDLVNGPPWRTRLLRHAQFHVLVITTHHLVTDGLSSQVLLDDLDALYAGRELPPLAIDTIDAIARQRAAPPTNNIYWRTTLAGARPLDLPISAPRTAWSHTDTAIVRAELSPADAARIATLAREADTTIFAVLVAAAAQLFRAITDRTDIVIGTIAGGRDHPELAPLVGLFINPLPLRIDAGAADYLRTTGGAIRAALAHADTPFERIVADANPERRPFRQPLFDVAINHHPPAQPLRLGDLTVSFVRGVGAPVAPYELMIRTIEHAGGITVRFDYHRDRFADATIRAWHSRYLALVKAIT